MRLHAVLVSDHKPISKYLKEEDPKTTWRLKAFSTRCEAEDFEKRK
jgi:hypothetical protein